MKKLAVLAAIIAVSLAGPAYATGCPKEVAAIDAALAKTPNAAAKTLRDQGDAEHKAGKHAESMATLAKAKAAAGIK
jgi:hypothetical protein